MNARVRKNGYPRDSATDLAIYRSPALLKLLLDAGGRIAAYFDAKGNLKVHRWLGNTYTKENHKLMRKVFRQRSRQCS